MKYKILIIDDEEMILSMMEKCLGEEFSVYTAENAKKALELYELPVTTEMTAQVRQARNRNVEGSRKRRP